MEGILVSEDPLGFDGGDVNLYAYCSSNPIMFVDPNGEFAWVPLVMAGLFLGDMAVDAYGTYKTNSYYNQNTNTMRITDSVSITPLFLPIKFDYQLNSYSTGRTDWSLDIALAGGSFNISPREPRNLLDQLLGPITFTANSPKPQKY